MENVLDEIANGDESAVDFLRPFYFGGETGDADSVERQGGLKRLVTERLGEIDARGINSIPLFRDDAGRDVVVRVGKYGPYLQRTVPDAPEGEDGDRAAIPEGLAPDELTPEKVSELFVGGANGERKLGEHPDTGEPIVIKSGRYGPYVSTGEKNASLLGNQSPEHLTLEEALKLLSLPRLVGKAEDGQEIFASPGRYGPYVKKGDDYRSLANEDQLFTVTLEEALALFAAPKTRGRRAAAPPLREMGTDPATEKPLVIKDGRFGPYVTDGEFNASLRRGQSVEELTLADASEMLADKRAKGPAPKRAKKAAAKKTTTTKKTTAAASAEGAVKKTATKNTATKKTAAKATAKKATAKKATPARKAAPRKATPRKATD
jgi:DNA topoisomerase-1